MTKTTNVATAKIGDSIRSKINANSPKELKELANNYTNRKKINNMRQTMVDDQGRHLFADGFDHINFHVAAATDLGRELAFDSEYNFTIPVYGKFSSIYALWTWLNTKGHPSFLRHMDARTLRDFNRTRVHHKLAFEHPHAKFICAYVLLDRINGSPELAEALSNTGYVPVTSYYTADGRSYYTPQSNWWVPALNLLRSQLIADLPLDVSVFSNTAITFDEALIDLDQEVSLGMISRPQAKAPVQDKKPAKKKAPKPQAQEPAVDGEVKPAPVRDYVKGEELEKPNMDNVRVIGFASTQARDTVMKNLFIKRSGYEQLFIHGVSSVVIPMTVRVPGVDSPDITQDAVSCHLYLVFNPETHLIESFSTALFPNPYSTEVEEVGTVNGDDLIDPQVRAQLGVPTDTPLRIYGLETAEKVTATTAPALESETQAA